MLKQALPDVEKIFRHIFNRCFYNEPTIFSTLSIIFNKLIASALKYLSTFQQAYNK